MSVVIGHKTLFLYDMDNADNPIELAFQPRYGDIVTYKWSVAHLLVCSVSENELFVQQKLKCSVYDNH